MTQKSQFVTENTPKNKDKLEKPLKGVKNSADLSNGMMATTIQGDNVTIMTENGVRVNGAKVVTADIETSNGVIHVIDAVILPN